MKLLNRSAISLIGRQPFIDWVISLPVDEELGATSADQLGKEGNIYLIDEVDNEDDFTRQLEQHWRALFENELQAWDEFGDHWPESLSYSLFADWFELKPQVMCFDIAKDQLLSANIEPVQ